MSFLDKPGSCGIYGDGSDGDLSIPSGVTTYTYGRDMYWNSVNIGASAILDANGFRTLCRTHFLLNGQYGIQAAPAIGQNPGNGSGGSAGNVGPGSSGFITTQGIVSNSNDGFGGGGGRGGSGLIGGGAAGVYNAPPAVEGGFGNARNTTCGPLATCITNGLSKGKFSAGGGGGGGGGDGVAFAGGGGGAGGTPQLVCARRLSGSGTIVSKGGNGGNSDSGGVLATGGGGSGGGGFILLYTENDVTRTSLTFDYSPGNPGLPANGGMTGLLGSTGAIYMVIT